MTENGNFLNSDSSDITLLGDIAPLSTERGMALTDAQSRLVLEKSDGAFAALWQGKEAAEVEAIACYYEISPEEVQYHVERQEFTEELIDGKLTPRAALRLGMRLDNEIGDRIRTIAVDVCEVLSRQEIRDKIAFFLKTMNLAEWSDRRVASLIGNPNLRGTVGRVRKKLEDEGEIPVVEERKCVKGGQELTQTAIHNTVQQEIKEVARSLGIPTSGLPDVRRTEVEREEEMFQASYVPSFSIPDMALAISKLCPEDILSLFKKADQWLSGEQVEAIEQAIAHRRIDWAA